MTFYYSFVSVAALAGVVLFAAWLIKTDWGTKALTGAEVRFNFMPDYLPFAVIFGWLILVTVSSSLLERITSDFAGWEQKFITYSGFILIEIFVMATILKTVKRYFQDGLRGFGLRIRGIFPDIAAATSIFIVAWPLTFIALYAVLYIGKMVVGPEFQIERNEGLIVILENSQLSLRILMIFFAVVVTPILRSLFSGVCCRAICEILITDPGRASLSPRLFFQCFIPGCICRHCWFCRLRWAMPMKRAVLCCGLFLSIFCSMA